MQSFFRRSRSPVPALGQGVAEEPSLKQRLDEVTGERDTLTAWINELTGERNTLVGQVNCLTEERNALVGQVNILTEERNALVGQVNVLTEGRNALVGQMNIVTEGRNALVGQMNIVTEERNALAGQVNVLTEERNALVGSVNELTGERNSLLSEIGVPIAADATIVHGVRSTTGPAAQQYAANAIAGRAVAGGKPRRAKFLILANMRTGSTWLEALLGALPDVATEYEFKWQPRYAPLPSHVRLDPGSSQIGQILEEFQNAAPVVGSKLILDLDYISRAGFSSLCGKLDQEIRIIHLVRDLSDIFISRRRGAYHRLNHGSEAHVAPLLKAAILDADIDKGAVAPSPQEIAPLDCYEELCVYVRNDAQIAQLRRTRRPYLLLDYRDIAERMTEIASFAGSEAAPEIIAAVVANPPTAKLPVVRPECVVSNFTELLPLFEHFEAVRQRVFDDKAALVDRAPA
jgi:uncharacterized protein YoxC